MYPYVYPWLGIVGLIVLAAIVFRAYRAKRSRINDARFLKEWRKRAEAKRERESAAYEAAAITFINETVLTSQRQPIYLEMRGPLNGWVRTGGDRMIDLYRYAPATWKSYVENDEYADEFRHSSRYGKQFIRYLRGREDDVRDFPGTLMTDMIAEAAQQQFTEITRGWPVIDDRFLATFIAARDGTVSDTTDYQDDEGSLQSRLVAGLNAMRKERKERVSAPIDVFACAQENFDRILTDLQGVLDEHKEGIRRLQDLILEQPVTTVTAKYDGDTWATSHTSLCKHRLADFLNAYRAERESAKHAKEAVTV